jgi:hypothetical protein
VVSSLCLCLHRANEERERERMVRVDINFLRVWALHCMCAFNYFCVMANLAAAIHHRHVLLEMCASRLMAQVSCPVCACVRSLLLSFSCFHSPRVLLPFSCAPVSGLRHLTSEFLASNTRIPRGQVRYCFTNSPLPSRTRTVPSLNMVFLKRLSDVRFLCL